MNTQSNINQAWSVAGILASMSPRGEIARQKGAEEARLLSEKRKLTKQEKAQDIALDALEQRTEDVQDLYYKNVIGADQVDTSIEGSEEAEMVGTTYEDITDTTLNIYKMDPTKANLQQHIQAKYGSEEYAESKAKQAVIREQARLAKERGEWTSEQSGKSLWSL